jgi:hypothetical protein
MKTERPRGPARLLAAGVSVAIAVLVTGSGGCNSPLTPVPPDLGEEDGPSSILDQVGGGHDARDATGTADAVAPDLGDAAGPGDAGDAAVGSDQDGPVDQIVTGIDGPDLPPPDGLPVCTAAAFIRCDGTMLVTCNQDGTAETSSDCGTPGCNPTAQRCNQCVPSSTTCTQGMLVQCGADGLVASQQTCDFGCPGGTSSRCADISPSNGLSTVLDALNGSSPVLTLASGTHTIDTDAKTIDGTAVTATVKSQGTGNPELLAIGYASITIAAGAQVQVTGARALALVSAGDITINGTLSVAATGIDASGNGGFVPGPGALPAAPAGGCRMNSGVGSGGGGGGGSNGFAGGPGGDGSIEGISCGGGGAAASTPAAGLVHLIGGASGGQAGCGGSTCTPACGAGGGGGGALQLVTRGTLHLGATAVLDAVGGGGQKGQFTRFNSVNYSIGGGGGGAGGSLLLEARDHAIVTGAKLGATGGGGGAGFFNSVETELDGQSGRFSATDAVGGTGTRPGGKGGSQGAGSTGQPTSCTGTDVGGGGGGGGSGKIIIKSSASAGALPGGLNIHPAAVTGTVTTR